MQIPDEMASLIRDHLTTFSDRAIARELMDMLLVSETPGEIPFDTHSLAASWCVGADSIWQVVEALTAKGLVQVSQGMHADSLVCQGIKSSAGAVKKKGKRLDMASIKQKAIQSRAADLKLRDVCSSNIPEMSRRIPLDQRNDKLFQGYQGWLPTAMYGLDGVVFMVTPDQIAQLEVEHPGVDVKVALSMMFDDLRSERHSRPTVPNAPYWVRQWIKKHGADLVKRIEDESVAPAEMVIEADY